MNHLFNPLRKRMFLLILALTAFFLMPTSAEASESNGGKPDVKEIVLGHMSDAYE